MTNIRSLAVFCGSRLGINPAFAEAGRALGEGLAKAGIRLVFGGGQVGIMGMVADAVLKGGGEVLGVIPEFLTRWEVAHAGVSRMEITDTMHTRKQRLYEEADAFLIMPGGLGTFDEAFEVITGRQLRLHDKPILLCDVEGSIRAFVAAIDNAIALGFATPASRDLFEVVDGVPAALKRLETLSAGEKGFTERL